MEHISNSLEDTKRIAKEIADKIKNLPHGEGGGATVVGLYGDLGSGKTTFMKYFAEEFGVEETIQSPTFIIMKIFEMPSPKVGEGRDRVRGEVFKKLIHIDAYRLEKPEELLTLGWNELNLHPGNLICIEWPERVAEIMPPHLMIRFEHEGGETQSDTRRKITEEASPA